MLGGVASSAAALKKLETAARKLVESTDRQQQAMRARDEALRAARDAGATYVEMQEASGLSSVTVSKALRRT